MSALASGLGTRGAINVFQAPQGRNEDVIADIQWPFVAPSQGVNFATEKQTATQAAGQG